MTDQNHILYALKFTMDGAASPLEGQAISDCIKSHDLAWVHLDGKHTHTKSWIKEEIDYLDDIIIDALIAEETRPRIVEFEEGVLLILRGVNLNENADPEDMISIRIWIDPYRIITIERRPLKATRDIHARLQEGKGPQNIAEFIVQLSSRLFERMEPVLAELDERTDATEEKIIDEPSTEHRAEIINIRKKAIIYRRYIAPQRDVISHLRNAEFTWLEQKHKRGLQESLDRLTRYVEDLDAIRERAQVIKDELANALADRLNKNMYILSVIAAIFLPLGFLTGLLGINVGGIPGSDNPSAFLIFSSGLISIVIIQIIIFKKLKWF